MGYIRARDSWQDYPATTTLMRAQDLTHWDDAIYEIKDRVYNVRDYGAFGDGVTDDTAAVQAAFTAAGSAQAGTVFFPPATSASTYYKISDAITVGFWPGLSILGSGMSSCQIRQTTNNTPIFKFTQMDTHSVHIADLWLNYSSQQTVASHPNSLAIWLQNQLGNGHGFYHWTVERVRITQATNGIGVVDPVDTSSGKQVCVWGNVFDTILLSEIGQTAIDLASTDSIGQPGNVFRSIKVLQGGSVVPTGPALRLRGEWVFDGLDVEDWYNQVIVADTGYNCAIRETHLERHHLTTSGVSMFALSDGSYLVDGIYVQNTAATHASGHKLIVGNSGSKLTIRNPRLEVTSGSGSLSIYGGSASKYVAISGVGFVTASGVGDVGSGNVRISVDGPSEYAVWTVDGLPPNLQLNTGSFPTASATYRGRMFRSQGAAGVADVTKICQKDAADAYAWTAIA